MTYIVKTAFVDFNCAQVPGGSNHEDAKQRVPPSGGGLC